MPKEFEELSVVRMKDDRVGTIVYTYSSDAAYCCIELEDSGNLLDIPYSEIKEIIWTPTMK